MKDLELSIEREIDFMIKYQLSSNELFVMKLIFYAQDNHEEFLSKYFTQCQEIDLRSILISLQQKGIINKTYKIPEKGVKFNPRDVDFNKNLIKDYVRHSEELGMDLFQNYPAFTNINGRTFSLRNITKLYKSIDEMCFAYGKEIKFDPIKHQEVMELLEWAKENNQIHSGICDFIASRKWIDLKQMRDEGIEDWNPTELL